MNTNPTQLNIQKATLDRLPRWADALLAITAGLKDLKSQFVILK